MPNIYSKGSEWRKWDLHVHTADSYDAYHGDDSDDVLVEKLRENKIAAVAITDHFVINKERIEKLRGMAPEIVFFPGVELRTDKGSCNIHVILIFDPKIDLKDLEDDFKYFKRNSAKNKDDNNTIFWDFEKIKEFAKERDALISIHAGGKDKGIDDRISNDTKFKQAVKDDYDEFVHIYDVGKKKDIEDYEKYVFAETGVKKPVVICSDNHEPAYYPLSHKGCNREIVWTWMKADPTFEGLKQVINEPERVFVGDVPDLLRKINTTPQNFITRLNIDKKEGSMIDEVWYDKTEIDVNPGLVAIIGNKGSGKSAIADITSLCANTHNTEWSFLTDKKFKMKPVNRSKSYEAYITWADNSSSEKVVLDRIPDVNQPERVRYIPQNFLENLCTTENDIDFEKELRSIIFQYLPDELKYEKTNLDEVIDYLSQEIEMSEKDISEKISEYNKRIVDLEEKKNPNFIKSLENALELKQKALDNLLSVKPEAVEKPVHENNEEEANKQKEIVALAEKIEKLEEQISEVQCLLTKEYVKVRDLEKARDQLIRVSQNIENVIIEIAPLLQSTELKIEDLISFSFKRNIIDDEIKKLYAKIDELKEKIKIDESNSLLQQKEKLIVELENKRQKLGEADRLYQNYLVNLKEWEEKVSQIQGSANIPDTINFYKSQIKYVKEALESDLQAANDGRSELVRTLLEKKKEILVNYASLYAPIREFISQNKEKLKDFPIEIQSTFIFDEISEKFFDFVSQGAAGTFNGKEAGFAKLKDLCDNVDLNKDDEICNFAKTLDECLKIDNRDGNPVSREVGNQLKKGHSVLELYDYIYGLSYIKPLFQLQMSGKKLSSLSPGERGAILLLFYLFIDTDDKPLIIDQPEENLDNESVYKYLVSFIKVAKKKRQIIMVTHNPNLAVVCDADQIIKMDIDKANKNTVSFISGAIENPEINQCIVDVLEGTYPAFDNRNRKYFSKESLN